MKRGSEALLVIALTARHPSHQIAPIFSAHPSKIHNTAFAAVRHLKSHGDQLKVYCRLFYTRHTILWVGGSSQQRSSKASHKASKVSWLSRALAFLHVREESPPLIWYGLDEAVAKAYLRPYSRHSTSQLSPLATQNIDKDVICFFFTSVPSWIYLPVSNQDLSRNQLWYSFRWMMNQRCLAHRKSPMLHFV